MTLDEMKTIFAEIHNAGVCIAEADISDVLVKTGGTQEIDAKEFRRLLTNAALLRATLEAGSPAILNDRKSPIKNQASRGEEASSAPLGPPVRAEEALTLILSPAEMEEKVGDFAEHYAWVVHKHGKSAADRWYWVQVLKLVPITLRRLIKGGDGPAKRENPGRRKRRT